ncbi:MAG: Asp-tRNA(Asn)/Glu-tRNA(Gln) amidotransferase GatCAB subunit C [Rickettsiales bacterium]|nr:Asp-tRNA(Asn)/Glu-tRNA(Gln) amidotransferase GatCAB subunit C [Rickettsiales bacterium]|tara:strand:- start:592 stop:882 length:291 start_codon:yes stop_codon:yes gene_type:complete
MFIDNKVTKKIASLAKIELTDEEIEEFSVDLSNILSWMEELKKVDVTGIEAVTSVNDTVLSEREDSDIKLEIEKKEVLKNAPDKVGDYFTVPKVIE